MSAISLSAEEARELRSVLSVIVLRERTGEIGVLHGLGRFVSTQVCKKKMEIEMLDTLARRCGLPMITRFTK